ncbi:MAG: F0F1 ATP synthase subunit gamma [Sulfurovaceae bacterium]|nr:F0F1 ATP synthase subunit gamma [Sulfurovaceae bacterium]
MSSSLYLTKKLKSTQEIEDIISTMKAFANYNIQNAKRKLTHLRTYHRSIEDAAGDIVTIFPSLANIEYNLSEKTIFVLFLSQEGLCGFFNENVIDFFNAIPKENYSTVIVGETGTQEAKAQKISFDHYIKGATNVESIDTHTEELSIYLNEVFTKENLSTLNLVYAKHNDKASYDVVVKKILPPDFSAFHKKSTNKKPLLYLENHDILNALIKEYLYISCYRAFIESVASENQERFNVMNQARNAIKEREQLIKLELNAFRQKEITQELLEIVTTYRAMIKK